MIELDKHGAPVSRSMKMENLPDALNHATASVKNTKWARDEKPYVNSDAKSALTSGEAHCLYDMSKRLGSGNYANLGVAAGKSLACLAWGLKHNNHTGIVYGVDLFEWYARDGYYQPESILNRLSELNNYFRLCKGSTNMWAKELSRLTFKGVFIDADHNYETAKLDFELWSVLMSPGGEIAFHDTNKNTVDRVIREMNQSRWQQTDHIFSIKVFKKLH